MMVCSPFEVREIEAAGLGLRPAGPGLVAGRHGRLNRVDRHPPDPEERDQQEQDHRQRHHELDRRQTGPAVSPPALAGAPNSTAI